jgi:tetratricopeptide (TPR) repeat protein
MQELGPVRGGAPALPWRDPHAVTETQLESYIAMLERACAERPESADLRTCLGIAYAMHYDVYKAMDALETAVRIAPEHFWAQLKYAELFYRLRALSRAEREMLAALELAQTASEVHMARTHLASIRRLMREGTQKPEWTKPLYAPSLAVVAMLFVSALVWVLR